MATTLEIEDALRTFAAARAALAETSQQRTLLVTRRERTNADLLEVNALIATQRQAVTDARDALRTLLAQPETP